MLADWREEGEVYIGSITDSGDCITVWVRKLGKYRVSWCWQRNNLLFIGNGWARRMRRILAKIYKY